MSTLSPGPFTDPASLSYLQAVAQMSGAHWQDQLLVQVNTAIAFDLLALTLAGTGSITERTSAAALVQMRRTAHLCSLVPGGAISTVEDQVDPLDPLRLHLGLAFMTLIDEMQAHRLRQLAGADVLRMIKQISPADHRQRGMLLMLLKRLMD